nr:hypothetical protein [Tanacetum cinerariifolium]
MKAKLALIEASSSSPQNPKTFQPKNKGLVAEIFDWDEEEVSEDEEVTQEEVSEDEEVTQVKVLMALVDDELTVGKSYTRNGKWVDITIRKVNTLFSMDEDADWQNYLKIAYSTTSPEKPLGASPRSEIMPLTFQCHSLKERPCLGRMSILRGRKSIPGMNSNERKMERKTMDELLEGTSLTELRLSEWWVFLLRLWMNFLKMKIIGHRTGPTLHLESEIYLQLQPESPYNGSQHALLQTAYPTQNMNTTPASVLFHLIIKTYIRARGRYDGYQNILVITGFNVIFTYVVTGLQGASKAMIFSLDMNEVYMIAIRDDMVMLKLFNQLGVKIPRHIIFE